MTVETERTLPAPLLPPLDASKPSCKEEDKSEQSTDATSGVNAKTPQDKDDDAHMSPLHAHEAAGEVPKHRHTREGVQTRASRSRSDRSRDDHAAAAEPAELGGSRAPYGKKGGGGKAGGPVGGASGGSSKNKRSSEQALLRKLNKKGRNNHFMKGVKRKAEPLLSDDFRALVLSVQYRDKKISLSPDRLTATGEKGYRTVMASHGSDHGSWYFEATVEPPPRAHPFPKHKHECGGPHARIGWACRYTRWDFPAGMNAFGYCIRDCDGRVVQNGRTNDYAEPFGVGDTVGCMITLPHPRNPLPTEDPRDKPHLVHFLSKGLLCDPEKPPTPIPSEGSSVAFTVNGKGYGSAFTGLNEGKYYPVVSLYMGASVRLNFGPKFAHPPPPGVRPACEFFYQRRRGIPNTLRPHHQHQPHRPGDAKRQKVGDHHPPHQHQPSSSAAAAPPPAAAATARPFPPPPPLFPPDEPPKPPAESQGEECRQGGGGEEAMAAMAEEGKPDGGGVGGDIGGSGDGAVATEVAAAEEMHNQDGESLFSVDGSRSI
ncbi:unnamed protein product [Vitrella brassicaformis CCMP3155]|uniref:B30.2/SPRY domain-containing protein n=2 Tax=Vitrella brassicaformis TaxID=1169539 RepID=A0A0G4GEL9_VITBC|nr:unnamed protein product [Vitrella brassicaformis CCMP3155]|eukprot:CEM27793.1 unnamed protein product [Vitrella brassicaformis CCMP3155]